MCEHIVMGRGHMCAAEDNKISPQLSRRIFRSARFIRTTYELKKYAVSHSDDSSRLERG